MSNTATSTWAVAVCGVFVIVGLLSLIWPTSIQHVALRWSLYERSPFLKRLVLASWVESDWYLLGLRVMGAVFLIAGSFGLYVIFKAR